MPLDGITAKALSYELNSALSDARVDKIYQPERFDLLLHLRAPGKQYKLYISANPSSPCIYLTEKSRSNPSEPPMFCMLMRKHLQGARILSIENPGYERIFVIRFQTVNELGDTLEKRLIIEIMGRHSNIILVNDDDRIHDSILHVDNEMSRVREIMPARPYQLPPAQDKLTPPEIIASIRSNKLWLLPQSLPKPIDKALLDTCQGFSPQLCQEIVERAGLDRRKRAISLDDNELKSLDQQMLQMLDRIESKDFQPAVFYITAADTVPHDFHALRLSTFAIHKQMPSVSAAMDIYYNARYVLNNMQQRRQHLQKLISNQLEHSRRKYQIHLQDCREGEKSESYKHFGDLILSSIHQTDQALKNGLDQVVLTDYYDPELKQVSINLQSNRTAAWNAQNYFRKYNKAKTKYETGRQLAEQDEQDISWLETLEKAVENAQELDDLIAIKQEMSAYGLISGARKLSKEERADAALQNKQDKINMLNPGKPGGRNKTVSKAAKAKNGKNKPAKGKKEAALPPRSWYSSDGFEIIAGRNNIQNDNLTLKTAAKNDIWLHVQKMPGTHVIVKTNGKEISDKALEQAAGIAAWFSKAGQAGAAGAKLPVDYCPVSHIRKPNGARPGMVIYDRYQTIIVEPLNPLDLAEFSHGNQSFQEI